MFTLRVTGQWVCQTCRQRTFRFYQGRLIQNAALLRQNVDGMPPGLLLRARKMALLHQELEQKAASITEYTPQSARLYKRLSELAEVSTDLKAFEEAQRVYHVKIRGSFPGYRRARRNNIVK